MNNRLFMPNEKHVEILNEIGRWKIISLQDLFSNLGTLNLYSPFCRTMRKLESEGFVTSYAGHRKKKYFSLSNEGSLFSVYSSPYIENTKELKHDLLSSFTLKQLLEFENFNSGYIVLEDMDVIPDALIHATKNQKEYVLALEIELHQKSKKRLIDKFSKYHKTTNCDYVLYITNKKSILSSYKKILLNMNINIQHKIILLLDENLSEKHFDYLNSTIWFKDSNKTFLDIFQNEEE